MTELPAHPCPSWCQQHQTVPSQQFEPDYREHLGWAAYQPLDGHAVPLAVHLEKWTAAGDMDEHTRRAVARFAPRLFVQLPQRFKPVDGAPTALSLSLPAARLLRDALTDVLDALSDAPVCPCGNLADANGQCDACRPSPPRRLKLVD